LQEYHGTLCDCLNAMGYSRKVITLEELRKEYDSKTMYGLFGACCVLPLVLADKGVDLNEMMETGTALDNSVYTGSSIRKSLQAMLPTFEEKGVFRY
jgi:hypothetical protein